MVQAASKTVSAADRRQYRRVETAWSAVLQLGNQPLRCAVVNISAGGAKIALDGTEHSAAPPTFQIDTGVVLTINGLGEFAGRIAWTDKNEGGIQFAEDPVKVAQYLEFAAASRPPAV